MRFDELPVGSRIREFGEKMHAFIIGLGATIDRPPGVSGRHLVRANNRLLMTFRFMGEKARTFPSNAIVLYAPWHDSFSAVPGVKRGDTTWHHGQSAEFGGRPEDEVAVRHFIRLAYDQAEACAAEAELGTEPGPAT